MRVGDFLNLLKHVKIAGSNQWTADCPCPSHKTPGKHLSVAVQDSKILVKCFGSDSVEDICNALKIQVSDLFHDNKPYYKPIAPAEQPKIIAIYPYKDETGTILYETIRYQPKDFRQRHCNGKGEYVWNLDGVRRILYHLDDLCRCLPGDTVYVVEGEKDADNMWMTGYVATTSPMGAGKWQETYSDFLKNLNVVIIPDKDAAGFRHARQVAASLEGKAKSISVALLPAKDFSEWMEQGADTGNLPDMIQDVSCLVERVDYKRYGKLVTWQSDTYQFRAEKISSERTGIHAKVSITEKGETLAWTYLNIERSEDRTRLANQAKKSDKELSHHLDRFCEGLWDFYLDAEVPELLRGDETVRELQYYLKPFIAKETGVILFAPPGRGKSYSALLWAISIDAGLCQFWHTEKASVLYINLERSRSSMARRLSMVNTALGLPPTRPLLMLNARGKSLSDVYGACAKSIRDNNISMIVLDSISRAGMGDLNENNSVNRIMDNLSSLCPTWLALAHTPRADESHVFGGIHFDAAADVVIQLKSQEKDGRLGVAYQVTKSNDIPKPPMDVYALIFDGIKLIDVELAKLSDFPDILANSKIDMGDATIEYIEKQPTADATATDIEKELGFNRSVLSHLLNNSGKFVKTRKSGREQFFGVLAK